MEFSGVHVSSEIKTGNTETPTEQRKRLESTAENPEDLDRLNNQPLSRQAQVQKTFRLENLLEFEEHLANVGSPIHFPLHKFQMRSYHCHF